MRTCRITAILLLAFVWLAPSPRAQAPRAYRILVTNDDGVRAPGIEALASAMKPLGEVTLVAPVSDQSGKGHSITISDPIFVDALKVADLPAYAVTATPATCVKIAIASLLANKPDLVVTGINPGQNLGRVTYVSGTVGAAREAALQGIPGIAFSVLSVSGKPLDFASAARAARDVATMVKDKGLPSGTYLNVNIPSGSADAMKGIRFSTQSMLTGVERFEERTTPRGRRYFWNVYDNPTGGSEGDDVWAAEHGYIAVVPLRTTEFDGETFQKLRVIR